MFVFTAVFLSNKSPLTLFLLWYAALHSLNEVFDENLIKMQL